MKANVGTVDRVIRVLISIALLSLLLILDGNMRFIGLIGIAPLLTALVKFCPLYPLFGINTNKSL